MAGDTHVLAFFWFQRFVAFICMLEQIISSNGKYSIVSTLFLLDMNYVGMLSVALCLDRDLSLIMSPGIIIMTLPRLMISRVLQLFPSIFKYSFMVDFDLFLLEPILRFIYSCLYCFLGLVGGGGGGGGYCHLYGLYGYVLLWGIWMGKWIQRVMHTCKLSQIPIQCQCCLIMGLFFPLSLTTRVWKRWGEGVLILPSCIPYYFYHFLSPLHPPSPMGLGAG